MKSFGLKLLLIRCHRAPYTLTKTRRLFLNSFNKQESIFRNMVHYFAHLFSVLFDAKLCVSKYFSDTCKCNSLYKRIKAPYVICRFKHFATYSFPFDSTSLCCYVSTPRFILRTYT